MTKSKRVNGGFYHMTSDVYLKAAKGSNMRESLFKLEETKNCNI